MKKLLQKSGSLLIALLVLFSTVSFTIDKHFCGEILVDQAVFSEAQTCSMHGEMPASSEEDCCDEEKVLIEGQKDLKISFNDLDLPQQVFLASLTYSYWELFEEVPQQSIPFSKYSPPLLIKDLQVFHETFLI